MGKGLTIAVAGATGAVGQTMLSILDEYGFGNASVHALASANSLGKTVEFGKRTLDIEVLEDCLGKKAERNLLPLQPGDVPDTYADVEDLVRDVDYRPDTSVEQGIANFVAWYREYYGV